MAPPAVLSLQAFNQSASTPPAFVPPPAPPVQNFRFPFVPPPAPVALIWGFFLLLPTVSEVFDLGFFFFFFFAALLPTDYELWIFLNLVSYFFDLFVNLL